MPTFASRKTADPQIAIDDAFQSSGVDASPTRKAKAQAGRIMYIECKARGLTGPRQKRNAETQRRGDAEKIFVLAE